MLTYRQTDRQTDKQTDSKFLPTPTDIVGVGNDKADWVVMAIKPGFHYPLPIFSASGSFSAPLIRSRLWRFINLFTYLLTRVDGPS